METIPTETVAVTATPMPKKGGGSKKKKNSCISSNKSKTNGVILKPDDSLLQTAIETNSKIKNCDRGEEEQAQSNS